ncbi:Ig-like domain repeat protein [Cellulomonas palmilytica]|uniref:Ig-like domain repeat protein n=1 Tax=Cellulomonas palmilytica TaxID=2608402 RepID=UPI001F3D910A|nr:Ig-like domain repeat protein [Cellulomonas palmilytica]UJP40831.1 Ig-like domain repeat protein [Cellulomonas palmilytica]
MTPAPTALPRTRSALLAIVGALSLLIAGLVTPAAAADATTVTGRVVFPAGYTYSAAQPPRVLLSDRNPGSSTAFQVGTWATVAADGTFAVGQNLRTDRPYVLTLHDGQHRLVNGYAGGGTTVQALDQATTLATGSSVTFSATLGERITGRVQLPSGHKGETGPVGVRGLVGAEGRLVSGTVAADGTFVVGALPSGTPVHLEVTTPYDLYGGVWNPADGFLVPGREHAGTVTAPTSGLSLQVNRAGTIRAQLDLPDFSAYESLLIFEAVTGPGGSISAGTAIVNPDDTATFTTLDTGRTYALHLTTGMGKVEEGLVRADGTVLPTYDIAEVWSQGAAVRPTPDGTTFVVRPQWLPALRGRVMLPEGYPFERDTLLVRRYERLAGQTTWIDRGYQDVRQDGTFTFAVQSIPEGTEQVLGLEVTGGRPVGSLPVGFWAGNDTAPVASIDAAKRVTPSRERDIVFPLSVRNATAPSVTGTARVGATLTAKVGTWTPASATTSVQWLRDGTAVSGATGTTYTLTAADAGKRVAARVTADNGLGWAPAVLTTPAVDVAQPIANVTRVSISGTVGYGKTVWVKRGEWSPDPVSTSVQWLRDGVAISGATGSSYKVGKSDVGKKLSVRVTAKGADGSTARSTSVATKVPKVTPSVKVSVPSVKAGTKLKATVTVDSGGLVTKPLGTVAVTIGSKTVKVTLTATHAGKVTVTLPAQAKGSHKVTAKYTPTSTSSTYLNGATSSTVTVKVT